MMPSLLLLLLLPLASGQVTETLRHGSIFGWLRAGGWWAAGQRGPLGVLVYPLQVFTCAFCLSHWGAAFAVALALTTFVAPWVLWVLVWLAVIRVSNFISDAWHPIRRTSGPDPSTAELLRGIPDDELEQEFIRRTGSPFEVGAVLSTAQLQGPPKVINTWEAVPPEAGVPPGNMGPGGVTGAGDQGSARGDRGSPADPRERQ